MLVSQINAIRGIATIPPGGIAAMHDDFSTERSTEYGA